MEQGLWVIKAVPLKLWQLFNTTVKFTSSVACGAKIFDLWDNFVDRFKENVRHCEDIDL